nr:zf-HC2 domain-containing protein [uncultured Anaerotignum sp.]
MEKISCSIVKDLLPLYIEGILSEETAQAVELHLQTCENCKKDFEIMRQDFVFPSAPKIQEENEKILKELKRQLKIKRMLTAVVAVFVTIAVVISGYMVYTNVGAVYDFFTENNMVVLRDIHTGDTWKPLDIDGEEYLNYDHLICKKEMVVHIDSASAVTFRIIDTEGNIVINEQTIEPGESASLEELKRNTDYKVEIKGDGDFVMIRFV